MQDLSLKAKLSIMATLLASLRRQQGDPSELVSSGWGMGRQQLVQRSAVLALVAVWRCSASCGWLQRLPAHRHAQHTCMSPPLQVPPEAALATALPAMPLPPAPELEIEQ